METQTISEQLRRIIRESPVTQAQLSRALGVTKGAISRFQSGSSISMEMMDRIGAFFNVKLKAEEEDMNVHDLQKPIGRPSRARKLAELIAALTPDQEEHLSPEGLMSLWQMRYGEADILSWNLVHAAIEKFKQGK